MAVHRAHFVSPSFLASDDRDAIASVLSEIATSVGAPGRGGGHELAVLAGATAALLAALVQGGGSRCEEKEQLLDLLGDAGELAAGLCAAGRLVEGFAVEAVEERLVATLCAGPVASPCRFRLAGGGGAGEGQAEARARRRRW